MRSHSTHQAEEKYYTWEESIFAGWAEDGGMLLPEHIPKLSTAQLRSWASLSYPELVVEVLGLFIAEKEIPKLDLRDIVHSSFKRFDIKNAVQIETVKASPDQTLHLLELWHGPTLAFKDLAMQVCVNMLSYFLRKRGKRMTLLVGTSGDTGSAAIEACRGLNNIQVVVLYPSGNRISDTQRLMMTSVPDWNIHCVGVEGSSDDLDVPLEAVFRDVKFCREHNVGSANSVNIGRLVTQTVHYIWAYLQVNPAADRVQPVAIPSGAAGHLTAGIIARMMGLPVTLHAATNENDILHQIISTGRARAHDPKVTNSPSMDIEVPYNIDRILYLLTDDPALSREFMKSLRTDKHGDVPAQVVRQFKANGITSSRHTSEQVLQTIRHVYDSSHYVLDPHSAVAVGGARKLAGAPIVMCTAHHAKFPETVKRALGARYEATSGSAEEVDHQRFREGEKEKWSQQLRSIITGLKWRGKAKL